MPEDIKLNISGSLPGEAIVVAIFNYAMKVRETQTPEVRAAWDKRLLELYDRWDAFWKNLGILK